MHQVFNELQQELKNLAASIQSVVPNDEPLNVAHGNWSFPGVSRRDLMEQIAHLAKVIDERAPDDVGERESYLRDFLRRLQFLQGHTVAQIWGNAATAVPAITLTLNALRQALEPHLVDRSAVDTSSAAKAVKRVATQLRGIESRLKDLEPRSQNIETLIRRIESAHDAADQLPTDLEALADARHAISEALKQVQSDKLKIEKCLGEADGHSKSLLTSTVVASSVLAKCESAYSAATSQGLAAAFNERSKSLTASMWLWVGGLSVALLSGAWWGSKQLHTLTDLIKDPKILPSMVLAELALAVIAVGAPVWFAWLSTKQIGQRFRLAEDYAFKASISRAYEGYRREAERMDSSRQDSNLEARLLASALDRLDELPLRLVETAAHGSPMHELIGSIPVKDAIKSAPGFVAEVNSLAQRMVSEIKDRSSQVAKNVVNTAMEKGTEKKQDNGRDE